MKWPRLDVNEIKSACAFEYFTNEQLSAIPQLSSRTKRPSAGSGDQKSVVSLCGEALIAVCKTN